MISKKTIRWMNVASLALLALYIAAVGFHLFRREFQWIDYTIAGMAIGLVIVTVFARLRRRIETMRAVKSHRASLLKHLWELRHRREW